jgi:nicotinamide mononucleotide (NMN) deamidase PncC
LLSLIPVAKTFGLSVSVIVGPGGGEEVPR